MSEYQLIVPPPEVQDRTEAYLKRVQSQRSSDSSIFVPAGVGVLISPRGHRLFSIMDASVGNVYDLASLSQTVTEAETADIQFCGVTTARLAEFKLMTHAPSPEASRILTARAIDLLFQGSAVLPDQSDLVLYTSAEGDHGLELDYQLELTRLLASCDLDYRIVQIKLPALSQIVI